MRQNDAGLTKIGHWRLQLYFSLVVTIRRRSALCVPRCDWPSAFSADAALKNVADNFHLAFRTADLLTAIPPTVSLSPIIAHPGILSAESSPETTVTGLDSRSSGHLGAHQLVIGQPETATADSVITAGGITETAPTEWSVGPRVFIRREDPILLGVKTGRRRKAAFPSGNPALKGNHRHFVGE